MESTDLDIGESPKRNFYGSAIQQEEQNNYEANELGDIVSVLKCMAYFKITFPLLVLIC